jgi:hypothetical protein
MQEQKEETRITGPRAEQLIALQESARFCKLVTEYSGLAWMIMFFMDESIHESLRACMSTAAALVVLSVLVAIFRSHQIEHVIYQAEQDQ